MAIDNSGFIAELKALRQEIELKNKDLIVSIFGNRGSGKSTLAINICKLLDPSFNVESFSSRLAHTKEDFAFKQSELGKFQALIWDEAHRLQKRTSGFDWNLRFLEFFSDSRGLNQITILCYPEVYEIDREVVAVSRLFLETYTSSRNPVPYRVRGWTKKQVHAMLAESGKLSNVKSIQAKWAMAGGRKPKIFFGHTLKNIEEENAVYTKIKANNLERTKKTFASYGSIALPDIILEISTQSKYLPTHGGMIEKAAYKAIEQLYFEERMDVEGEAKKEKDREIEETPAGWVIKTSAMKNKVKLEIAKRLNPKYLDEPLLKEIYQNVGNMTTSNNRVNKEDEVIVKN